MTHFLLNWRILLVFKCEFITNLTLKMICFPFSWWFMHFTFSYFVLIIFTIVFLIIVIIAFIFYLLVFFLQSGPFIHVYIYLLGSQFNLNKWTIFLFIWILSILIDGSNAYCFSLSLESFFLISKTILTLFLVLRFIFCKLEWICPPYCFIRVIRFISIIICFWYSLKVWLISLFSTFAISYFNILLYKCGICYYFIFTYISQKDVHDI